MRIRRYMVGAAASLVFAVAGSWTVGVAAHTLEQDNGVSAVMHIAPDDNPRAGQETYLNFSFTSRSPGFDVRYCACTVTLQATENRLLGAKIIGGDSATAGTAVLTFPRGGAYDLTVQGFTSDKLQERFRLEYRIRVSSASANQGGDPMSAPSLQVIMLSVTSLVLLGMLAASMIRAGDRYRQPRRN